MGYTTQMDAARQGIITREMEAVAAEEHMEAERLRELVAKGDLGIKTGKGFFEYPEEERAKAQDTFYKRLIIQLKASKNY